MDLVHVDGSQDGKGLCECAYLEEPLHFKTASSRIVLGKHVKDYPQVPPD